MEILYFAILHIEGQKRYIAVASCFSPPDPHLLDLSSKTYWSVKHLHDNDIRAIDLTTIVSCVMMAPDHQYRHYRTDGSEVDRWFLMEKPGLKLASLAGSEEEDDMDTDD